MRAVIGEWLNTVETAAMKNCNESARWLLIQRDLEQQGSEYGACIGVSVGAHECRTVGGDEATEQRELMG